LKLGHHAWVLVLGFFIFIWNYGTTSCILKKIDVDWSKVAIGSLPHTALGPEELDLTEVEWVRIECQNKDLTGGGDQKRMLSDRFDWNTLSRKRRRRGGQNKEIVMTM